MTKGKWRVSVFSINSLFIMAYQIYLLLLIQCHQGREPEIAFIPGGKSFGKFYACPNQSPLFQTFVHILSPYSEPSIASIVFRLLCMVCKALLEHPMPNIVAPCSHPVSSSTCDLLERRNCSCRFCVFDAWHATGPNKLF